MLSTQSSVLLDHLSWHWSSWCPARLAAWYSISLCSQLQQLCAFNYHIRHKIQSEDGYDHLCYIYCERNSSPNHPVERMNMFHNQAKKKQNQKTHTAAIRAILNNHQMLKQSYFSLRRYVMWAANPEYREILGLGLRWLLYPVRVHLGVQLAR